MLLLQMAKKAGVTIINFIFVPILTVLSGIHTEQVPRKCIAVDADAGQ